MAALIINLIVMIPVLEYFPLVITNDFAYKCCIVVLPCSVKMMLTLTSLSQPSSFLTPSPFLARAAAVDGVV